MILQVGASNDYEEEDDDDDEDDISFFKSHFQRKGSFDDSSGERLRKLEGKSLKKWSNKNKFAFRCRGFIFPNSFPVPRSEKQRNRSN